MKISFLTTPANLTIMNGYGKAGYEMLKALQELGHETPFRDASAPVEIAFCQPEWVQWSNPDAYHIQYTPWESTELPEGWVDFFNNECDEVWTPSPLIAQWYEAAGVVNKICVYEHGIDHNWSPRQTPVETDRFTWLHMGSPAPRKHAQTAVDAFLELHAGSKDHLLVLKVDGRTEARLKDAMGNIVGDIFDEKNIKIIRTKMPEEELINLHRSVNAAFGLSSGEGFGLIPFQSMAVGLPTVINPVWAPYKDFALPDLSVSSTMIDSPWPHMHPGKMFQPEFSDVISAMQYTEANETKVSSQARANAIALHVEYDWVKLTRNAFAPVIQRFSN